MQDWLRRWDHGLMTEEEVNFANEICRKLGHTEYNHPSKRGRFNLIDYNQHYESGPNQFKWKTPFIQFYDEKDAFFFALCMGEVIAND